MSFPKKVIIKESPETLKKLLKNSNTLIRPRIRMLQELQKHSKQGISKRNLAEVLGVNHNSVQTWRSKYIKGGLDLLCSHNMKGYKPSILSKEQHKILEAKMHNPENGLQGYKELLIWIEKKFGLKMKYITLYKYCRAKFGTKIKVARKSHINKDKSKEELFKKTLLISAKKQ